MLRIVQPGAGTTRPLVLVYHQNTRNDAAMLAASPAGACVANDTETTNPSAYYSSVPALADTMGQVARQVGASSFSPIILCGFSAGGFATRRVLDLGGDPDALLVADATYGTSPGSWGTYAARARAGQRVMLASYTSLITATSTWGVLSSIVGFALPLGASVANRPVGVPVLTPPSYRYQSGRLVIYGFPTEDVAGHQYQQDVVLPSMLAEAQAMLAPAARPSSGLTLGQKIAIGASVILVVGVGVYLATANR